MAVSEKPNEEYWELKARIKNFGFIFILICLFVFPTLAFGGTFFGHKLFPSHGGLIGLLIGGLSTQTLVLTLLIKKVGFLIHSKEKFQRCRTHIG
jgi:hypothetical protein